MCLAFLRLDPASDWPVLLASVRDEDLSRPTVRPGYWWPEVAPRAAGGRDERSGGTWLAVDLDARALAAVFTPGEPTPLVPGLRSRGELPLLALTDPSLASVDPVLYEPFALLRADARTGVVAWWAWDRGRLSRTYVQPGFHVGNIAGLDAVDASPRQARWVDPFRAAAPDPFEPGAEVADRWPGWLALFDGALEVGTADALLGRHDVEQGSYGTRSAAMVALPARPGALPVHDWSPTPGDPATWAAATPGA